MTNDNFWFSDDWKKDWCRGRNKVSRDNAVAPSNHPPYNYKDIGRVLGCHFTRVGQLIRQHGIKPEYGGNKKYGKATVNQLSKILNETSGNL